MKSILSNNKITMIISLCLALFLWFYVAIFLNPEIDVTIRDVPVVYSDMQGLSNRNLAVINDQEMKMEVRIRGDRRTLKQINNKNISAIVDLNDYSLEGEYEVPIKVNLPIEGAKIVNKSIQSIRITVDRIVTTTVDIKIAIEGFPRTGYVYTNDRLSEKKAVIKGPQSIIKTVRYAKAPLNVSGKAESLSSLVDLTLMSDPNVEVNSQLVEITPSKVEAMCTIGYAKTVKVSVPIQNDDEKGLVASPVEYKEVTLVGDKLALDKINKIETEPVDAKNGYYEYDTELKLVLPEGIITQSGKTSVKVHVGVVKVQ
ncbi:MAG: CdaR family protein [Eubacteriales bacterium]|nr:CdaR family protein [Eubacteriales bacterium]